jgi:hypothetical protein
MSISLSDWHAVTATPVQARTIDTKATLAALLIPTDLA